MKRFLLAVIALLFSLNMFGCSKNTAYGAKEAIKRGDVVYQLEVFNLDRFEEFLMNISTKKKDTIRVTGYTIEGDPIFQDLQYDGKVIHYKHDSSNDKFAGTEKGVVTDVCKEIIHRQNSEGEEIEYYISGCSKNQDHFLISVEENSVKKTD